MSSQEWSEKNVAQKGFTLIELLIVIAILGILAVVGILAFGGLREKAQTAVDNTELKTVETAVDAYIAANPDVTDAQVGALDGPALQSDGFLKQGSLSCTYSVTADAQNPVVTPTC